MARQLFTLAWITYREALYGKFFWVCLVSASVIAGGAELISEVVITGADELQKGFLAWALRWLGVVAVTLFCVNSVIRDVADKITEMLTALPIRRETLYLGKLIGVLAIAASYCLLSALLIVLHAPWQLGLAWASSQFLELIIVAAFVLWIVTSTGGATGSILIVVGFYLLSRAMQGIATMAAGPFYDAASAYDHFMLGVVHVLSWILPPLYEFASADWLVTSVFAGSLGQQLLTALLYSAMLLVLAIVELYRKQY